MSARPEIVCLCGSTQFLAEMRATEGELTLSGAIVVGPAVLEHAGPDGAGKGITPEQKAALDVLHRHKIDLADRVLVVNPGGYVGESTRAEIAYARSTGTPVTSTDPL